MKIQTPYNPDAVIFGGYGEGITLQAIVGEPGTFVVGNVYERVSTGEKSIEGIKFEGPKALAEASVYCYNVSNSIAEQSSY